MTDHLRCYVEYFTVPSQTSFFAIKALVQRNISRHCIPSKFVFDQGSCFTSHEFSEFCEHFNLQIEFTSAGSHHSTGTSERVNDIVKRSIAKYIGDVHNRWESRLPWAVFSHNSSVHSVTKLSPFAVLYGRTPCLPCDKVFNEVPMLLPPLPHNPCQLAIHNTEKFRATLKNSYDSKHPSHPFEVGDIVLLSVVTRKIGQVAKFFPTYIGPFVIKTMKDTCRVTLIDCRNDNETLKTRIASTRHLKTYIPPFDADGREIKVTKAYRRAKLLSNCIKSLTEEEKSSGKSIFLCSANFNNESTNQSFFIMQMRPFLCFFDEAEECKCRGCRLGIEECSVDASDASDAESLACPSPTPMEVEEPIITDAGIEMDGEIIPDPGIVLEAYEDTDEPMPGPSDAIAAVADTVSPTGLWAFGYPVIEYGDNYLLTEKAAYYDDGAKTLEFPHPKICLSKINNSVSVPVASACSSPAPQEPPAPLSPARLSPAQIVECASPVSEILASLEDEEPPAAPAPYSVTTEPVSPIIATSSDWHEVGRRPLYNTASKPFINAYPDGYPMWVTIGPNNVRKVLLPTPDILPVRKPVLPKTKNGNKLNKRRRKTLEKRFQAQVRAQKVAPDGSFQNRGRF